MAPPAFGPNVGRPAAPQRSKSMDRSIDGGHGIVGRRAAGTRRQRDAAMELLVDAARGAPVTDDVHALIDRATPPVILRLAAYHGASGLLYEWLHPGPPVADALADALKARYADAVRRHMLATAELTKVADALDARQVPWVAVKGPVLVESLYEGRPGRRGYYDIDVLVDPGAFGQAVAALDELGAGLLDRNWRMLRQNLRGEVLYRLPSGTPLDLHWDLVNMYRLRMRVDTAGILDRARSVSLATRPVPTLDPEDGLVYLALHAALAGGDRLLWLKDIERAAARWQPSWPIVIERARSWRVAPAVGLLLARSRDVLGAPVPDDVIERLTGRVSLRMAGIVERFSPWAYGMGRTAAPTRLVARSVGHGLAAGSAWIAWRSLRNLDPRQERRSSAFREAGTRADWEAFVKAVERTARGS